MAVHRVLVIATVPVEHSLLREQLRERSGGEEPEVRIVAPAADVSPLEWLANDEDDARAEAEHVADDVAGAVGGEASVVDAGVGESDPVKAIEDALREWPADEVVVVTARGEEANWLERGSGAQADERFGVPVTHLAV
ncbi:MAG: hypothetical protein KY396_04225 [Actinobacteria bacterium]|nr:hypothetical protein [Actinomycetota bacterium]